jgi:hypothetical protein
MRDVVFHNNFIGLRALPGTRKPHQNQIHKISPLSLYLKIQGTIGPLNLI